MPSLRKQLTLGAHAQRGLRFVWMCLSTTILALQATGRFMSDTSGFGTTKYKKALFQKRLHSGGENKTNVPTGFTLKSEEFQLSKTASSVS